MGRPNPSRASRLETSLFIINIKDDADSRELAIVYLSDWQFTPDGDGGRAIGPYQIHRVYWQDAVGFRPELAPAFYATALVVNVGQAAFLLALLVILRRELPANR